MRNWTAVSVLLLTVPCVWVSSAAAEKAESERVGKRPYELDWAGRVQDDHPPLIDFETPIEWRVVTKDAVASFQRSREQQIWGKYVGKLTYRADGRSPEVRIEPVEPLPIRKAFDAVTCWIYGNNWAWAPDPNTPQVRVDLEFADSAGRVFRVHLTRVRWKEWFLCHRRLAPDMIERVRKGGAFRAFIIAHGHNRQDRVLYFDNLAVFREEFPPLHFQPRPKRGIDLFAGQDPGLNTGPGRLPFPTRPETILPDNLAGDSRVRMERDGAAWTFRYEGDDGRLVWRVEPDKGVLAGLSVQWSGRTGVIRPCVDGGLYLAGPDGSPIAPEKAETVDVRTENGVLQIHRRLRAGGAVLDARFRVQMLGKSLVVDILAPGGRVAEVRYGRAIGFEKPRVVRVPYLTYGRPRPGVVVAGSAERPIFFAAWTDWYRSNASTVWGGHTVLPDKSVLYNGGVRYIPKTDGRRNGCFERWIFTLAPRFEEVLPNIPNPVSPWKHVTGTRVWRAHGAGNRDNDIAFWRRAHRYGLRKLVVTDHETMWRDGGESFTFRTRAAPGKGGDEGARRYARIMQDELGFVYGPYNNFTDFAPVNGFWNIDRVTRTPDNQLQRAWARCYAPKPAFAVEACEQLAPRIQEKFHFSTAYCDVHTAVAPWDRVDYDARVPGAGTFAAVFYAFGEIMLLQKKAWNGPVYSEGGHHFLYCGLTDGNYAQDQRYQLPTNPWLVDFDLLKLHPLCCNFGMGNPGMFYGRHGGGQSMGPDEDAWLDRFLAAAVAFGHPGFLVFSGGMRNAMRSYYLVQALHSKYTQANVESIRYVDAAGNLLDTSTALARGNVTPRSQIVTRYQDGTVTVVNGSRQERLRVRVDGRDFDLPPNGWWGRSGDGTVEAFSGDRDGRRCDYVTSPDYLYVDGRGRFVRFPQAAGSGLSVCRTMRDGNWEVILFDGKEAGFAVNAERATAVDEARKPLGPAELRRARGLTWVMPVKGAFSYVLHRSAGSAPTPGLECDRDAVVPGETVVVRGRARHTVRIPRNAAPGTHQWFRLEGKWIDFVVVPPAEVNLHADTGGFDVQVRSRMPKATAFRIQWADAQRSLVLEPEASGFVRFPLPPPRFERVTPVVLKVKADTAEMTIRRLLITERACTRVAGLPGEWRAGCCLRGRPEQWDFEAIGGHAGRRRIQCGGVWKDALAMHPPYKTGVGYTFALFAPMVLPREPRAAFRALVGKGDGSDPGDGILYRVMVVDADSAEHPVAEHTVAEHRWEPIEADLTPWAGKTIRLKLIADVGRDDNSIGDWACWAEMRIESLEPQWVHRIEPLEGRYAFAPPPVSGVGVTPGDLRKAERAVLHFDGMGLEGRGSSYETEGVFNDISLGPMPPAHGSETNGVWQEDVCIELPPEAVKTLSLHNRFVIRNPAHDCFKIRRVWIEVFLPGGRRAASYVSTAVFSQPSRWAYAEGVRFPENADMTVDLWFPALGSGTPPAGTSRPR